MAKCKFDNDAGFSLVEVLAAMFIFAVGLIALAQMFVASTHANRAARGTTFTMVLAQQKMEQLRGLMFGYDLVGLPLTDLNTNLSVVPETNGGSGLSPSPPGALIQNIPGFVDYLDQYGRWVGTGGDPVPGTVYIRRWSIEPLPTNPNNTIVLQVLVTRTNDRGVEANAGSVRRMPEEARLVAVRTRKTI